MWHTNLVVSAGLKMIVCDELPLAFWALSFSAFLSYDSTIYKQATQGQVTKKWMLHLFKSNAIELLSKPDGLKTKMLLWKRTNCFLSTEKIKNVKIRGYFSLFFFIVSSPFSKSFVFEVFSVHKKTQSGVFKFFRFDERFSVNGTPNPRNNDTFSKIFSTAQCGRSLYLPPPEKPSNGNVFLFFSYANLTVKGSVRVLWLASYDYQKRSLGDYRKVRRKSKLWTRLRRWSMATIARSTSNDSTVAKNLRKTVNVYALVCTG